ncbi:phosphodiesterase [Ilumatobacteraceae bacterium]|nr:phosphodiesterase [Ilumatobacteraceae bacterium]
MTLLLQVSDPHIIDVGRILEDRVDTAANLSAAIGMIDSATAKPDLLLLTGDLVNNGRDSEYEHLAELLRPVTIRMLPVMGNHDDRQLMRDYLDMPPNSGSGEEPCHYVVDLQEQWGPTRIIVLDTTEPGRHGGLLCAERLSWLDNRLSEAPDRSTIVVQHHPPIESGIGFMDRYGLVGSLEEAEILAANPQVVSVLAGHLHRPIYGSSGGRGVVVAPSCAAQVALDLGGGRTAYTEEPGMVAWHRWNGSHFVSHHTPVGSSHHWVPEWAQAPLS